MPKRTRNPDQFTLDEAQTATLLATEGTFGCYETMPMKGKRYRYPLLRIRMCDKQALEPASKTITLPARPIKTKKTVCRPELFPPDGKGIWEVVATGKKAENTIQRLQPILTEHTIKRWKTATKTCI